jgi:UDP-2-acetamido-2-deoxy-ribo-hexuluronate aminotransferase
MTVPFYTSTREYAEYNAEFDAAVKAVMSRGDFILGKEVQEFEKEAATWLGAKYAIGLASGSDALVLGADILGLKEGAEVITPTFTFFASTSCVARLGGKPVFVDMDEETLNMDLDGAEKRITKRTKGIIPVHLFFQACDLQKAMDLARSADLKVLEDAAEAWGMTAMVDGKKRNAGTVGDIGVFSFFPTKTLGGYGDAGLAVTNDEGLFKLLKSYRMHGSSVKYHHEYIGYNSRLDTIQAAILRVKLAHSQENITKRKRHAEHYLSRLSGECGIRLPNIKPGNGEVWYVFNILFENRDRLVSHYQDKGIGYSIYYPIPLHLQKCFSYLGHKPGDFPVSERISGQILALPMFPELTDDEVDFVCDETIAFLRKG